mmetsp:Transcript_19793/g.49626  ORF Transcript_19793/g.49626 Transcript_19793/m.49626 type:complete len:380 (-) Transcript_19793:28-1167(-)
MSKLSLSSPVVWWVPWFTVLLADGHAEAELVVLVDVVDLGAEGEREAGVEALFQEGGHHPSVVDAPAQPALPQDVVVPHAGRRLPRVPVPHEVRRQHGLVAHLGGVGQADQARGGHLARRHRLVVGVARGKPHAALLLPAQIEPLAAQRDGVGDALQVVDAVELPVAQLDLRLRVQPLVVQVHHHLREPRLLGRLQLGAHHVVDVVLEAPAHPPVRQHAPHQHVVLVHHVGAELVRGVGNLDDLVALRRHLDGAHEDAVAQEELLVQLLVEVEAPALEVVSLQRDHDLALQLLVLDGQRQVHEVRLLLLKHRGDGTARRGRDAGHRSSPVGSRLHQRLPGAHLFRLRSGSFRMSSRATSYVRVRPPAVRLWIAVPLSVR